MTFVTQRYNRDSRACANVHVFNYTYLLLVLVIYINSEYIHI